jgi:hypothetical protein
MNRMISALGVACLALAAFAGAEQTRADRVLERLRGLAGDWEGTLEWSGARTGSGRLRATYSVTGGGSAVVENLIMEGQTDPSMTSVYHVDGSDLRMTHYCAAHNQPRLKASRIDEAGGIVEFSFVDATDLGAHPSHVTACEIRFLSAHRLRLQFTFEGGGRTSVENIDLHRVGHAPPER